MYVRKLSRKTTLLLFAGFLAAAPYHFSASSSRGDDARPAYVVLRNGQVVSGDVRQTPEGYSVTVPEGEIRVRASEVECATTTLADAYERLRAGATVGLTSEHLRLAQWCIRQGLEDQARRELADAAALTPQHPMIEMLRRRLEVELRPSPGEVHPEPVPPKAPASVVGPSQEELEKLARSLPPRVLESFSQTVQPLLANQCATGACHGATGASSLKFFRTSVDRPINRRQTLQNLNTALKMVDRQNPSASKLLTTPLAPHGTARTAVLGARDSLAYRRLAEWVFSAAAQSAPHAAVAAREPPAAAPAKPASASSTPAAKPEKPPTVHDPFDPEAFNRRFFGQRE